jgi:transposase
MMCYAGMDLPATNSVVVILDEAERVLYQKRLRHELSLILAAVEPYRPSLREIAIAST